MKIRKITSALVLVTAVSGAFALGCELIVDFDRTKIPVEDAGVTTDASFEAGFTPTDAGPDAVTSDVVDSGAADAPADG
jgi:hypothetical protein